MALSRRALGVGILGLSAAATAAVIYGRSSPLLRGVFGEATRVLGFIGGEKERLVANPDVIAILRRQAGLELDARRAGSIEMVREKAILDQAPQFLWPSSSILVDLARANGVKIQRDQVILNSPIVIYSWDTVAKGLVAAGFAQPDGPLQFRLDLAKLLGAIVANKKWSEIGVPNIYGNARLLSTDPNRSNSGFMFAGLAANLLAGEVVTASTLAPVAESLKGVFARMGYKPSSSGKMFEDYLAGGPGAQPLIVGYENQLIEWVLEDEARWQRLESVAPAKPVILYPQPTVFSAHPMIVTDSKASALIETLMSPEIQTIAWNKHGFRGPLGTSGEIENVLIKDRIIKSVDAVLPMPDITTMLALIDALAR
jgi:hypothetical protein